MISCKAIISTVEFSQFNSIKILDYLCVFDFIGTCIDMMQCI